MHTISNKKARERDQYRNIMAAALWAYRAIKKQGLPHFEYDPTGHRYFSFCSSAYFPIVDTITFDRQTGKMWVDCRFNESPKWRTIMIFE